MNIEDYPQILRRADCQKEKSILAKVLPGKKTGISEALADCERLYPAFKQAFQPIPDKTHVTPQVQRTAAEFGMKMLHARDVADDAGKKWGAKLCPVPKATRIHAENISKRAAAYYTHVVAPLVH